MDSVPGASCRLQLPGSLDYQDALLFGSSLWKASKPTGIEIPIENTDPGIIHEDGLIVCGIDGALVNVKRVKLNGSCFDTQNKTLSNDLFRVCFQVE